jgi:N-methylhydantoinase A
VVSIGAGGSSIVHVSESGLVQVGPESAGSQPGPACYGRGGTEPTVTDALLVAGVLSPERFAGGRMKVEPRLAHAVLTDLGLRLGLSARQAADAVGQVATARMLVGVRGVLGRLGVEAGDLSLIAFGGAGPVFAALLADEVGLGRVLVPTHPGTLCALGALRAELRGDFVRTVQRRTDTLADAELAAVVTSLYAEARRFCARVDLAIADARLDLECSMKYRGQAWTLDVPVPLTPEGTTAAVAELVERFHVAHERTYHHADRGAVVEIVDAHCAVTGPKERFAPAERPGVGRLPAARGERRVFMGGAEYRATIVEREALGPGERVEGVAVIEQDDTTTYVPPGWVATQRPDGNLVLERCDATDRR